MALGPCLGNRGGRHRRRRWSDFFLPETWQLVLGVPAILVTFFAVLWTKGFGPEDRELFRMRKSEVSDLREAEQAAAARDQIADDSSDLVPEVPHSGEEHREPRFVRGGYHLFVANRAARLDDCGRPRFGGGEKPIGKGEKGIGRDR